ncbi:hypothetical protein EVAR_674_1 [Eumeta japonica]|uniref:Uncharacterized protein n=1 Tax=Eumeta variegata TaxID=151549 RepID=A0A4C1SBE9_EUMVA|nr:hypothetical protein EVAR_674_1 [Eumeta japonica]
MKKKHSENRRLSGPVYIVCGRWPAAAAADSAPRPGVTLPNIKYLDLHALRERARRGARRDARKFKPCNYETQATSFRIYVSTAASLCIRALAPAPPPANKTMIDSRYVETGT